MILVTLRDVEVIISLIERNNNGFYNAWKEVTISLVSEGRLVTNTKQRIISSASVRHFAMQWRSSHIEYCCQQCVRTIDCLSLSQHTVLHGSH